MSGRSKILNLKNINELYEEYSSKNKILKRTKLCDYYYSRLIDDVILNLKNFYDVNWNFKSWELFIGPFVHRYVSVIYDRIEFYYYLNKKKINLSSKKNQKLHPIASKRDDFLKLIEDDSWNINLLNLIYSKIKKKKVNKQLNDNLKKKKRVIDFNFKFLKYFFYKLLKSREKILIYKPYWNNKIELAKLLLKLKIFPIKLDYNFTSSYQKKKNAIRFSNFKTKFKNLDKNEKLLRNIFFDLMPEFYIEDFETIKAESKNLPLSNNLKKIYSSLCIWEDTVFKFWLCENLHRLKLYYSQHGVNYGMTLYSYSQVFEKKLSDFYLTWGWNEKKNKNIVPFYSTKVKINQKSDKNLNKKILIINSKCFKYLPENHTAIFYGYESKKYNEKVQELLRIIPKNSRKNFYIKNYPYETLSNPYNLNYLKNKFINYNFINDKENIFALLENSELVIHTYMGTTFLECIRSNIPCLLIMDVDKSLLNFKTKKLLKYLEKKNIVHKNQQKLIRFIQHPNFNIKDWWNDKNLQAKVKIFCKEFVRAPNSLSGEIYKKLA